MDSTRKQREAIVFSYDDIHDKICAIKDKEDQFIFAVAYANGTRVSELLGLKADAVAFDDTFVYVTTPVLKKRLRKKIKVKEDGVVVGERIINKPMQYRNPPIHRKVEDWLANIILDYASGKQGILIPLSRRTLQRRFESYFGCISHSFRHTRATHCFRVLGMSMLLVTKYFGVTVTSGWVERYGHLDISDLRGHYANVE